MNKMMKAMLMFAMIAGCVLIAAAADEDVASELEEAHSDADELISAGESGTVNVGGIDILEEVAGLTQISDDVCELYDPAMKDKPIDWDKTQAAYEEEHEIDGFTYSLQSLAQEGVEVFGLPQGEHWAEYAEYFGDESWMDTFIEDAISGATSDEVDDVRKVYVQKEARDGIMTSLMLEFLDDAHDTLADAEAGADIEEVKHDAREEWDAAWAVYYGSDTDQDNGVNTTQKCAPYGTADRKAEDFGADNDVNAAIMADITSGQEIIEGIESEDDLEAAAEALEPLIEDIVRELIVTYLRSAVRYAERMDAGAALEKAAHEFDDVADFMGSGLKYVQKAQGEGYVFTKVVIPLVAEYDSEAADYLMDAFSDIPETEDEVLNDYEEVLPGVLEAVGSVLEAIGITEEDFGVYDSDRETTD